MDEFTPEGVNIPLDEYVGPLLDESAREVLEKAPLHLLSPTAIPLTSESPPASLVRYADDKSYIPVPSDFVRLYEIKYPLWKKSVREAISAQNPNYKIQENEFLKGGYGRPSVALVQTSIGGTLDYYLECSKVVDPGAGTLTPIALYVKNDQPEDIADLLSDAMTWLCAAKVLAVSGYGDRAKMAMEQFSSAVSAWVL